ncbi:MAG: hypothetical protein AAFX99_30735, partial [Myxococcota bacterium]
SVIVRDIEAEANVKATGPDLANMKHTPGDAVILKQEFKTYTLVREGDDWRVDLPQNVGLSLEDMHTLVGLFFGSDVVREVVGLGKDTIETTREIHQTIRDINDTIRDTVHTKPNTGPTPPAVPPPVPPRQPSDSSGSPPAVPSAPHTSPEPPKVPSPTPSTEEPPTTPGPTPSSDDLGRMMERGFEMLDTQLDRMQDRPSPSQAPSTWVGAWRVQSGIDPMTDVSWTQLTRSSDHAIGDVIPRHPELRIHCENEAVFISVQTHMLVTSNFGSHTRTTVQVRVGEAPASSAQATLSDHHHVLTLDRSSDWLDRMARSEGTLKVLFTVPVDERHMAQFKLDGLREALGHLPQACRP